MSTTPTYNLTPEEKELINRVHNKGVCECCELWKKLSSLTLAAKEQEFVEKLEALRVSADFTPSNMLQDGERHQILQYNNRIDSLLQEYKQGRPDKWEGHEGSPCAKCNLPICKRTVEQEEAATREIQEEN